MRDHRRLAIALTLATVWLGATPPIAEAQFGYPYPPPRFAQPDASVRLEVTPKEAEVYVDGYYAGIVNDFDGMFQRLHLPPGEHDITLYREGYRSATQHVYLTPDNTFKVRYTMERLGTGEVAEARPTPANPPPQQLPFGQAGRRTPPPDGAPPQPYPPPPNVPPPNRPPSDPAGAQQAGVGLGTISIRLQPMDAEVLIDGQPWRGAVGQNRLLVDVSEGRHSVQVRKPGFVGFLTEVQVRRGETTTLDISLRPQP